MPRPIKLTISVEAGTGAWDSMQQLFTEGEDDLRLAIEKTILKELGQPAGTDPYTNPMGVFVVEIEVTT